MTDTRPSPPAFLRRIRAWFCSDMLVLRWVLMVLYVAIVGGLFLWSWLDGGDRLFLLVFVVLTLGCQALFILGGGTMQLSRPIRKRRLWMPVLVAALMFGVLAIGLFLALGELFYLDRQLGDAGALVFWAFVVMNWLFWFLALFLVARDWQRMRVLGRITGALIAGSLAELLAAAVSHTIVSRRPGCLVGVCTMIGILAGLYVMLFAFGPGIVLLFLRRRYRREQIEGPDDSEYPSFHFSLRTVFLVMLVVCVGSACVGVKLERARRNRRAEAESHEVKARIERLGGTLHFEYDARGDSLDELSRDPGVLRSCVVEGGGRFDNDGLKAIGQFTSLRTLRLNDTHVTDAGLVPLEGLTNLRTLDLVGTQVTDAGLIHLKSLPHLATLNLTGTRVTDAGLVHLSGLTNLQELDLSGKPITDTGLTDLKELAKLRHLDLAHTHVTEAGLEPLRQLSQLQTLDLSRCGLMNVDGLRDLSGLGELHLGDCDALANVDGLRGLTELRYLDLAGCAALTNVDGLQGLTGLRRLHLDRCARLSNVDGLRGLPRIERLRLSKCDALTNVNGLRGLGTLQDLYLGGRSLRNLDGLQGLTRLDSLRLSNCSVHVNLDGLGGLTAVTSLNLDRCASLTDVDCLQGLSGLESLQLSNCETLKNLDGLRGLKGLRNLSVSNCDSLTNVDGLRTLTGLESLVFRNCDALTKADEDTLRVLLPRTDVQFQ